MPDGSEIKAVITPVLNAPAMQSQAAKAEAIWSNARFSIGALETSKFTAPLGRIKGQLGEFEKSLEASNARVIAFGASAGAIFAITAALKDTVRSAIQVEKSLADIAAVMGRSVSSMDQFGNKLFNIANDMGQGFSAAAKGALELSRQGLGTEDTLKRLSAAMLLSRQSGLSVEDSVTAITAAMNSFSNQAVDAIRLVNQLSAVDQKFAVNSGDLAEALKRVGSTANDAGASIEELVALVTAAQQTTQRGGAVIGNAFKSIFTRIQGTKAMEELEGIGVQVKNLDGSIRPVISVLGDLSNRFDSLTQVQQNHVAQLVGGTYQINILRASLKDVSKEYSVYKNALSTANSATDEAIRRNEELNKTLSAQIGRSANNFTRIGANIGNLSITPAIKKLLNTGEALSDTSKIGESIGTAIFSGIGKILSGPGISALTLIFLQLGKKLLGFVGDAVKQISGINDGRKNQADIERSIVSLLSKEKEINDAIRAGTLKSADVHELIVSHLKTETAMMERINKYAKENAELLNASGYRGGQSEELPLGIAVPHTKAGGYIPEMMERYGALAGGYRPGEIRRANVEGKNVVYNSAEQFIPYKNSAFIIPPKGSAARAHYDKELKTRGIDPSSFAATGAIPNLAPKSKAEIFAEAARAQGKGEFLHKNVLRAAMRSGAITFEEAQSLNPDLKEGGELAAKEASKQRRDALFRNVNGTNVANMFVYDGPSHENSSYGFEAEKVRVLFDVAGLDKKQLRGPTDLQEDVGKFLQKSVYKFANKIGSPVNGSRAKPYLDKAVTESKSNIFALVGDIFEHGFGAAFQGAIQRSPSIGSSNFDIGNVTPELKRFFPGATAPMADFKVVASPDARESMANKILVYKGFHGGLRNKDNGPMSQGKVLAHVAANHPPGETNFYGGLMPNLSALKAAMLREVGAGYNPNQVRVGYDSRIGPLVYNTTEGSAKHAVDIHRRMGKSIDQIKKQGINKYSGNLPNLAIDDDGAGVDLGLGFGLFASQLAFSRSGGLHAGKIQKNDEELQSIRERINVNKFIAQKVNDVKDDLIKQDVLEKENNRLIQLRNQDESRRSKLLSGSLIIPAIGGVAENSLEKVSPGLAKSVGSLSEAISNGALIAYAIPGHIGLVIGALSSVALGASKVFHAFSDKAPALERALDKERDNFESISNSTSNFAQAFDKLNDAYQSQTASADTITKLQQDYATALAAVPDEYRNLVASAGSAADAQRLVSEQLQKQATHISQLQLASSVSKRVDASRGIFADTSVFNTKTDEGKKQLRDFAARAISTANKPQDFAARVSGTNISSAKDFVKLIESAHQAGEIGDELADSLERLGKEAQGLQGFFDNSAESLGAFSKSMQETAKATKDAVDNFKITAALRKSQAAINAELKASSNTAKDAVVSLTDSIKALAGQGIAFANTRATLGNQARSNLGNNQISILENALSRAGNSLGESVKGTLEDTINLLKTQLEGTGKFRQTNTDAVNNMFTSVQKVLEEIVSKAGANEEGSIKNPFKQAEATKALQALGIARSGANTPTEANKAILEFISRNDELLGEKFQTLIEKNDEIVRELTTTKAQLDQDFKEQIKLTLINNQISQEARVNAERNRRLGGAEGFLNPVAFKDALSKTLKGAGVLGNPNDRLVKGRGAFDLLTGLKEIIGGDLGSPAFKGLRSLAITGRAEDIRSSGGFIANTLHAQGLNAAPGSLERAGLFQAAQELRRATSGPEAAATARTQIENAIALQQMPNDVAKQVDLLRAILGTLNGDITSALKDGAEATKTIETYTPDALADEISKKQNLVTKFETREKDVRNAQEIVSSTQALVSELLQNSKNDSNLQSTLQNLFSRGDITDSLKVVREKGSASEKTRATDLLKKIDQNGGANKFSQLLNTSLGYESKTAFAVTRLLALGSTVGSIFTHDHSVVGAIEDLPNSIAEALGKKNSSISGGGLSSLLGKLGQGTAGAIGVGSLALLLGTRGGRAGTAAAARFGIGGIKSLFGRAESPVFSSLLAEEQGLQAGKFSIGSLSRLGSKIGRVRVPDFPIINESLARDFGRARSLFGASRAAINRGGNAIASTLNIGDELKEFFGENFEHIIRRPASGIGSRISSGFHAAGRGVTNFGRGAALFGGALKDEAGAFASPFIRAAKLPFEATGVIARSLVETSSTIDFVKQQNAEVRAYRAAQAAKRAAFPTLNIGVSSLSTSESVAAHVANGRFSAFSRASGGIPAGFSNLGANYAGQAASPISYGVVGEVPNPNNAAYLERLDRLIAKQQVLYQQSAAKFSAGMSKNPIEYDGTGPVVARSNKLSASQTARFTKLYDLRNKLANSSSHSNTLGTINKAVPESISKGGRLARFAATNPRLAGLIRGGAGVGVGGLASLPFSIASDVLTESATNRQRAGGINALHALGLTTLNTAGGVVGGGVGALVAGTGVASGALFGGAAAATAYPAYLTARISQEKLKIAQGETGLVSGPLEDKRRKGVANSLIQQITTGLPASSSAPLVDKLKKGEAARSAIGLIGDAKAGGGEGSYAQAIPQIMRALGVGAKEARSLLSGYTKGTPNNNLYSRLTETQNQGKFSSIISNANIEGQFAALNNKKAASISTLKESYGIGPKSLQEYYKRTGGTGGAAIHQAAFIKLAEKASKGGLEGPEADLFKELGGQYFQTGFNPAQYNNKSGGIDTNKLFGSENGKAFSANYAQNIKALGAQGVNNLAANAPALQQQYSNVNGYTFAGQDKFNGRRAEWEAAQEKVFFRGSAIYKDDSYKANWLRNMPESDRNTYLGQTPSYRQNFLNTLSPEEAYRQEQSRYKQQSGRVQTRPNQTSATNQNEAEDFAKSVKDALNGDFAKNVGTGIANALKGEQGGTAGGQLQISWPKLEVQLNGDVTIDGKPAGPDNNIVVMITNEIFKALGRPDLIKPEKKDAGNNGK